MLLKVLLENTKILSNYLEKMFFKILRPSFSDTAYFGSTLNLGLRSESQLTAMLAS